jgi:hypothetical protein
MRPTRASRTQRVNMNLSELEVKVIFFAAHVTKIIREERHQTVLDLNIAVSDVH